MIVRQFGQYVVALVALLTVAGYFRVSGELGALRQQHAQTQLALGELRGRFDELLERHERQTALAAAASGALGKLHSELVVNSEQLARATKRADKLLESASDATTRLDAHDDRLRLLETRAATVRLEFDALSHDTRNSTSLMVAAAERARLHGNGVLERAERLEREVATLRQMIDEVDDQFERVQLQLLTQDSMMAAPVAPLVAPPLGAEPRVPARQLRHAFFDELKLGAASTPTTAALDDAARAAFEEHGRRVIAESLAKAKQDQQKQQKLKEEKVDVADGERRRWTPARARVAAD